MTACCCFETDAPLCYGCGSMMIGRGATARCLNCGATGEPQPRTLAARDIRRDPPITVEVVRCSPAKRIAQRDPPLSVALPA